MKRRALLNSALMAGTFSLLASKDRTVAAEEPRLEIIDTNVSLFHWPFRRLPLDETDRLVKKLSSLGIGQAWAGSFEGVFQRDIRAVNQRLVSACAAHDLLVPIGSINPELPGWEDDLRRCREDHHMPGIRLHPNYHGYSLADENFPRLLSLATNLKLFVQIAVALEDIRTQAANLQVADVDLTPLPEILKQHSAARLQILNWKPRGAVPKALAEASGVYFDTARVEGTDGVAALLNIIPSERVMFGTHAPFLIPEASLIRVHESKLANDDLRSVLQGNANRIHF